MVARILRHIHSVSVSVSPSFPSSPCPSSLLKRVSCNPSWPRTHSVAENDLELHLPPHKYWGVDRSPPAVLSRAGGGVRASCVLGKHPQQNPSVLLLHFLFVSVQTSVARSSTSLLALIKPPTAQPRWLITANCSPDALESSAVSSR